MAILRNKHWINKLPHIYEIDDMLSFCKQHGRVYLYGRGEEQEYLLKFLDMCGVPVAGFVVTFPQAASAFAYRELPVRMIGDVMREDGAGVILSLPDRYHGEIVPMFRDTGFADWFSLTEHTRMGIAEQLKPRAQEEMAFEISVADHCNLSCQMCDHFSQLSDAWLVDPGAFKRDMRQMARIFDHKIGAITLLGGEPTLHPDLGGLLSFTRSEFPEAEIILLTNGVLLEELEMSPQGNLWAVCRDNRIRITVTVYPIKLDYLGLEEKARQYGVSLRTSSDIHAKEALKKPKISDKHTMDLEGRVPKGHCVHCLYFNKFNAVKDGRYYMCPVEAHIDIFNKRFNQNLTYAQGDYLDIYKVEDWRELSAFSSQWIPFCRFCDQKNWGHGSEWKASNKRIEEYI